MDINTQYKLKSDNNYIRYIRENSNWYKYLNRNPIYFNEFEKEMRVRYKMTSKDKLERLTQNIDKISQIIDIFS